MGEADINATDDVSCVTVTYELVPLKYNILIWYLKLIPTCLIPRLSITSNILRLCFDKMFKELLTIITTIGHVA